MSYENNDTPMSLVEHLEELRKRIVISAIAIAVAMAGAFIFQRPLLRFLMVPLGDKHLITLSPTESFMTVFKVAAYVGVIVSSPVIFYQIWAFVAPGLRKKERRLIIFAALFTSLLFLGGIAFSWFLVLPKGLDFLLNYEGEIFDHNIQAARYFTFVAFFVLGFGLIFELPAMVLTLVWVGILNVKQLTKHRKYAIVIGAVISAAITPGTDFFSMIAMFVPFLFLYELSVVMARVIERMRRKKRQEVDSIDNGPEGEAAV